MKKIILLLIYTIFFTYSSTGLLFAEKSAHGKIRIAIMDFAPKGGISEFENETISESIRSEIIQSSFFEVVERSQINKILKEKELKLTGILGASKIKEIGEIFSVNQIIIGTVGKLYGNVIITLRLVDAETGKNIFAHTLYSTEKNVFSDIKNLVSEIGNKALIFSMEVTTADIRKSIKDDNYKRAWFQLNRYRENHPTTDETVRLKNTIARNLSKEYYKDARKSLKNYYFRQAKNSINNAIAIENREKYIKFRARITEVEREYNLKLEIEKKKRLRDFDRYGEDYKSFGEKIAEYYCNLSYNGILLAVSSGVTFDRDYKLDEINSWYGFDILGIRKFFSKNNGLISTNPTAYAGLNFRYLESSEYPSEFVFNLYASPFLSTEIKAANFFINLGLDAGGIVHSSGRYNNSTLIGATFGSMAVIQFKMWRSFGVFTGFKFDYQWYPENNEYSFYESRIMAGIIF